jgi:hypothetical protein
MATTMPLSMSLRRRVEVAIGAPIGSWPPRIADVIRSGSKLGYNAKKHLSLSRHVVWVFLLHHGVPPALAMEWLHTSGRVDADSLHELLGTLRALRGGMYRNPTTSLRNHRVTPATLPETSHDITDVVAYAHEHGTRRGMGSDADGGSEFASERTTYLARLCPLDDVARLLHRRSSPFHMREVSAGKTAPIGRARPVLSLDWLRWAATTRGTSLHAGVAHDGATQTPLLGNQQTPLRTELCLEIDEVPTALPNDDRLRWVWLKHALGVVLDVLRTAYGFEHVLTFASGNRGPHCWLLDERVLEQTTAQRRALFHELQTPTEQPWWRDVRDRCRRFHDEVLVAPCTDGGFGLAQPAARPDEQQHLANLTWPRFDAGVVLGATHTHRVPFSVHETTMRIAVPFRGLEAMPASTEEMPHVCDPALGDKLAAPLAVLRATINELEAAQLLAPTSVATAVAAIDGAPWVVQAAERKRKRDAAPPECVDTRVTLAPLRLNLEAMRAWREALLAAAADPSVIPSDAALAALAKRADDGDERARLEREVKRLDVLLGSKTDRLENVVVTNDAGARMSVWHPAISQHDFVRTVAPSTRHAITGHQLLELDISAAHPSTAWGALVAKHGATEAERRCPCLAMVVTDRERAVATVVEQYHGRCAPADAKTKILRSLNQSANDETHAHRKPFLRALVEERPAMETALREFAPLSSIVDAIEAKARKSGKETTLLSLLMQATENAVIVASIPRLAALGWACVGVISDAVLLEGGPVQEAPEVARKAMEDVGAAMDVPLRVKIDHVPCVDTRE